MNELAAVVHVWMTAVTGWSQAATGSLVAAVWQGIVLACVAGLGLRVVPKASAAVRFAIWFGVFVVEAALPVMALWPHDAAGAASAGAHGAWFTVDARWCLGIAAVWAVASVVRAGTLVAAALRVRALWKRARPMEPGDFVSHTHGDGAAMNGASQQEANTGILRSAQNDNSNSGPTGVGSRRAQICTSDEVDRPTVIGFFAPKILIPSRLLEKLTAAELEQVVLHETGHLGRADDWMNLLQKIALVVFPLNPALAWVERRLCFERELAVDERVLQAFAGRAGAAKAYAACLATLAEYRLGRRALALALGALGRGESELGRRVGRILRRGEGMKPLHARLVLCGAMLGLVVAATGFERCPQVVGFETGNRAQGPGNRTAASGSVVADAQQWLPTHGDKAAMNGAPSLGNGAPGRGSYRAVSVVYKTSEKRKMQVIANVTHQVTAAASWSGLREDSNTAGGDGTVERVVDRAADRSARMVRTGAPVSSDRSGARSISDTEPVQPASVVMQWMVVTTWRDGVGTQTVFASTRMTGSASQETAADPGSTASEQAAPQQGLRYAAVPVQGGWLVFQL